ncbi:MAG TPA: hypothetical protein VFW80_06600 [Gaiellaceae bacterium]|nr:hypothetical protein [Gaiellaceae bacterium]
MSVENDTLRSGGIRTPGSAFRGSAVRLKKMLERESGVSTWVQAVVAVWGDFPQGVVEEKQVVYLEADRLREWLEASPKRLDDGRRRQLVAVLEETVENDLARPALRLTRTDQKAL